MPDPAMPSAADLVVEGLARDVLDLEDDAAVLLQALRAERELRAVLLNLYVDALRDVKAARTTSARLRDELRGLTIGRAA